MDGPTCRRRGAHENAKQRMAARGISATQQYYHRSRCFSADSGGGGSSPPAPKVGINTSGGGGISSTPPPRHCGRARSKRAARDAAAALLLVLIGAPSTLAGPAARAQETFKELPAPSNLILDAGSPPSVVPIPPSTSSADRAASKPVSPALIAVLVVCSVLLTLSGVIWFYFRRKRRREAARLLLLNSPDSLDKDVVALEQRRWTTYTDSRMGGIFSQQQNPWSVDGRKSGYSGYTASSTTAQSAGERKQYAWAPPPPLLQQQQQQHSQAFAPAPRSPISPVRPNAALAMGQRPETQYEHAAGGVWGHDGRYWEPRWEGGARAELMTASMYSRAESRGAGARASVAESVDSVAAPGEQARGVVLEQARVVRMAQVGRV